MIKLLANRLGNIPEELRCWTSLAVYEYIREDLFMNLNHRTNYWVKRFSNLGSLHINRNILIKTSVRHRVWMFKIWYQFEGRRFFNQPTHIPD